MQDRSSCKVNNGKISPNSASKNNLAKLNFYSKIQTLVIKSLPHVYFAAANSRYYPTT